MTRTITSDEPYYYSGRCEEICWSRIQNVRQRGPRVRPDQRPNLSANSVSFPLSFVFCNEFVEFLCVTARGSPRQRSDLVFRLCDLERAGAVTFKQLATVLKSVSQLGKATIALSKLRDRRTLVDLQKELCSFDVAITFSGF